MLKWKSVRGYWIASVDHEEKKDETIYHIGSECSKLEQKEYKIRHDWVGGVIRWELGNILNFDHTTTWSSEKVKLIRLNGISRYKRIT